MRCGGGGGGGGDMGKVGWVVSGPGCIFYCLKHTRTHTHTHKQARI